MRALFAFFLLSLAVPGLARGETVEQLASPNGELAITVSLTSARLAYKVDYSGAALLPRRLSLVESEHCLRCDAHRGPPACSG